jgi:cytochrome c biogenesis factor
MSVEQGAILVHADTSNDDAGPILSADLSTKPMIGLLWVGTILLGVGCVVAWARRRVDERLIAATTAARLGLSKKQPHGRSAPRPAHARQH